MSIVPKRKPVSQRRFCSQASKFHLPVAITYREKPSKSSLIQFIINYDVSGYPTGAIPYNHIPDVDQIADSGTSLLCQIKIAFLIIKTLDDRCMNQNKQSNSAIEKTML